MNFITQKKQRYQKFKPKESVELVKQYLSCIDELANVHLIFSSSLKMLSTLKKHSDKRESDDPDSSIDDSDKESAKQRIDWAVSVAQLSVDYFEELLKDLRQSYTAVRSPRDNMASQ
jgi:hypothetical protein